MIRINLPQSWLNLAILDTRIASGNLSFEELEAISQELAPLLYSTSDRVKQVAQKIFDMIATEKQRLMDKEQRLIPLLEQIHGRIQLLWLKMETLTPEEVAEEIYSLGTELNGIKTPSTARVKKILQEARAEVETLKFHFIFPIADELEIKEGRFAFELQRIADQIREGQTPKMLDELNKTQREEVARQLGSPEGVSPEGVAHAIEEYLSALCFQTQVAKLFFEERVEEGFQALLDLPQDIRLQIDQLISEAAKGELVDPSLPEAQTLMAASILHSVEQRMGMHDE